MYFFLDRGDYGMEGFPGLAGLMGVKVSTFHNIYNVSCQFKIFSVACIE